MLIALVSVAILAIQWVFWILGRGRFRRKTSIDQCVWFIFADFLANIINHFRHLLALVLVLLFGGVLALGLLRAGTDTEAISSILQAVASSLGGLIGAIIGYYFGESAGRAAAPSGAVTKHDVEQGESSDDAIQPARIGSPT